MAKDKTKTARQEAPAVSALESSPGHLLHRVLQLALDVYAEEVGRGAVTQRQFAVLAAVEGREGQSQTDLVRLTGIDRSTLADMVQRMITKGLLVRERSPDDARANTVGLTEAGRAVLDEIGPKVAAADTRLLKRLSSGKRRVFLDLLRDLAGAGPEAASATGDKKKPKKTKAEKAARAEAKRAKKAKKAAAQVPAPDEA
jgi:DNA-binding MarR family transcriptional regulator